jgi:hypothetical protein
MIPVSDPSCCIHRRGFAFMLFVAMSVVCGGPAISSGEILTFDELPGTAPTGWLTQVPANYGGLQWRFFYYTEASRAPAPSGYVNGVVSPGKAVYSGYADWAPAVLSVTHGTFDLNSAYVTAAWQDGVTLEAQGFKGGRLIYDTGYTINAVTPSLINFNYLGIDQVSFYYYGGTVHPGYQGFGPMFVIDNLNVTIVPEPSTLALACVAAFSLPLFRRRQIS